MVIVIGLKIKKPRPVLASGLEEKLDLGMIPVKALENFGITVIRRRAVWSGLAPIRAGGCEKYCRLRVNELPIDERGQACRGISKT